MSAPHRFMPASRRVTLMSHGPQCLDGLTCAVIISRNFAGREIETIFTGNNQIDEQIRSFSPLDPGKEELWITDISWRQDETDAHLNRLIDRGLELYWVDHHKTAIDRKAEGHLDVNFTDHVLDDRYCASRLLFEHLCARAKKTGESHPGLLALENLVMLADDVDRWVLEIDGSRELALAVRTMRQDDAFRLLLSMDSKLTHTPALQRAMAKVGQELQATLALAAETFYEISVPERGVSVVSAECDGFTGEVADRWTRARERTGTVYALYDRRTHGVSMRRSPDCSVDLSRLAGYFGGGGHAAAAGCNIDASPANRPMEIAGQVADALADGVDR